MKYEMNNEIKWKQSRKIKSQQKLKTTTHFHIWQYTTL